MLPRRVVLVPRVPVGRHPRAASGWRKHQLAVKVATATNACVESEVTDLLMAQLLEAYARGGGGGEKKTRFA